MFYYSCEYDLLLHVFARCRAGLIILVIYVEHIWSLFDIQLGVFLHLTCAHSPCPCVPTSVEQLSALNPSPFLLGSLTAKKQVSVYAN